MAHEKKLSPGAHAKHQEPLFVSRMFFVEELNGKLIVEDGCASSKETPCFLRFALALAGSHSNVIMNTVYVQQQECQESPNMELTGLPRLYAAGPVERRVRPQGHALREWRATYLRSTLSISDCQPSPVDLKYATTSGL